MSIAERRAHGIKIPDGVTSGGRFSECQQFRYYLTRSWDSTLRTVAFIGLNPSRADLEVDDRTVGRCQAFARQWKCGRLLMLNLFACYATKPKDMLEMTEQGVDIIGGEQNSFGALRGYIEQFRVAQTVAAWGKHGGDRGRDAAREIPNLVCLRINRDNSPGHPLYISSDTSPLPFP